MIFAKKDYQAPLDGKGFAIIEIAVSFMIIAIITTALISVINPAEQMAKARDSQRKSDLSQIKKVLESYYDDNGRYPPYTFNNPLFINYLIISNDADNPVKSWGSSWQPYINVLPKDPQGHKTYAYYAPDPNGQSFYLYASLERETGDPDLCDRGNKCPNAPVNACGDDFVCNFGVTSKNVSP